MATPRSRPGLGEPLSSPWDEARIERRRYHRLPLQVFALVRSESSGKKWGGPTVNVSPLGLLVRLTDDPSAAAGDRFDVTVVLPKSAYPHAVRPRLLGSGTVVWTVREERAPTPEAAKPYTLMALDLEKPLQFNQESCPTASASS